MITEYIQNQLEKLSTTVATKTEVDDTTSDSTSSTYSAAKIEELLTTVNSMRGVAVFVQTEEPADPQLNDIWIKI